MKPTENHLSSTRFILYKYYTDTTVIVIGRVSVWICGVKGFGITMMNLYMSHYKYCAADRKIISKYSVQEVHHLNKK